MTEHVYWRPELECMGRPALEQHQLAKLRQQLAYVSERSPLYRRKFAAAGIKPDDIRTLADLRNIPFTEKQELKDSQSVAPPWGDFSCIAPDEAVRVFQTSGTTGTPVRIMYNRQDWFETFYEQFQHYRCGYGMTEADVMFVPFNYGLFMAWWGFQTAMERAGVLCVPGGGQSSADRLRAMIDWGATVVCGTPSYLLYLAEMAAKGGPDLAGSAIARIIAAGEPGANVQATKKALESQWGAECFDDVGSTEISNFGFECRAHDGTHVVESMFLAEVLDTESDAALPDGEVGELVLSNLACTSTPLIRYRMRDLVRFNRQACACGRTFLRLDGGVLGRSDDMFHFAGVNVFPSQIQNLLHGVDELSLEYQLRIPRQGSGRPLTIEVEPAHERLGRAEIERAREHLIETVRYRVGITPAVEVVEIGSLPRVEGKAKRLIREE